jgi:hypothetical protein
MPIGFTGTADLVSAFAGGDQIENASYGREAQRLLNAANTQASMEKRVQEAYALSQQNQATDAFQANPFDLTDFQNISPEQQAQMAISGLDFNNVLNALQGSQEIDQRARLEAQRLIENFTPGNAIANATQASPQLVGNREEVGDAVVGNFYGQEPVLDAALTAANAAAGRTAGGGAGTEKERIIRTMVDEKWINPETGQPWTYEQAFRKVNFEDVRLDQLGNAVAVNEYDPGATRIPLTGGTFGAEIPAPVKGQTLRDLAKYAFGPTNFVIEGAGKFVDLIPGVGLPDASALRVAAKTKFSTAVRGLVRALAQTRAFREQEFILKELTVLPSALTGEETAETRIDALEEQLQLMLAQEMRDQYDPSLGDKGQAEAAHNVSTIQNFLPMLGSGSKAPQISPDQFKAAQEAAALKYENFYDLSPADQLDIIEFDMAEQEGNP